MGFIPGSTTEIEAFLTKRGAELIMSNGVGIVRYFAVSDDASNYVTTSKLSFGQMFSLGGNLFINNKSLSVVNDQDLRNKIFVNNSSETYKTFESNSGSVVPEEIIGGIVNSNFFNIYQYVVDRTSLTYQLNWLIDLSLPYGVVDNAVWNTTFNNGGFSNTAISDMNTDTFLIFALDGSQHAYMDGKTIKVTLPYYTGTTDLYSTFLNVTPNKGYYDGFVSDKSAFLNRFGKDTVLLFSDFIQRPNNDSTKSWSTGYDYTNGPFGYGNKSTANFTQNGSLVKDVAVGIIYLDKGVVVIFNPALVNGYVARTNNNINVYNKNIVKRTVSNFICDLPMGNFYRSKNPTYSVNTPVRISTIGLYNEEKELLAIGRVNSEIEKSSGQRLTFLVKLVI